MDISKVIDQVTPEKIERRMTGWSAFEWEGVKENYYEYRAALGPEATKTLSEFAYGLAAQNELYAAFMAAQ